MKEFEFKNTLVSEFKITSIRTMLEHAYNAYSSDLFLKVSMSTMKELEVNHPTAFAVNFLLEKK